MISRRNFIRNTAAASAVMVLPSWCIGKEGGPNSRLNVAFVGVGNRGAAAIDALKGSGKVRIAAFCDVDDAMAANAYNEFPDVPRFRDYRVMLDRLDSEIDAVVISTPDHMHYPQAAWAIAKGKHVFCEKPLTRTIWEARELRRLAAQAGVITQMGNQGHTLDGWRSVREWYDSGLLGQIESVFIWTNRPIWPQGFMTPPSEQPVPETLDYNLWLGVAPNQPYNKEILPFNWRGLRNYGTGASGDMACHFFDVPYSAFDLGFPKIIRGNSEGLNDYCWPKESSTEMVFENARGVDGKITMNWYDGGRRPKAVKRVSAEFLEPDAYDPWNRSNCTFIVGTKETVLTNDLGSHCMVYPRDRMAELSKSSVLPPKTLPRSEFAGNPHLEWVACCLEGRQPPGSFDYAAPFIEMSLLSTVAFIDPNKDLFYEPEKLEFSNSEAATRCVKSLYEYKKEFLP